MLPQQKLQSLSFCNASPKAFNHWVSGLPMANVGEASRQLYNAIIELNQLELPAPHRLQLMEMIRPRIYHVCELLGQHFLGHPITLPEKQRKIANLSQALQLHLAHGYKLVLMGMIDKGAPDKQRQPLALAAHRAITALAATLLRAAQLYSNNPIRCWHEAHQIFRYIQGRHYGHLVITDDTESEGSESSVEAAYKRLLLLGCCRPNQLRQQELKQVYQLFYHCTDLIELNPAHDSDTLFVVDTVRDLPPIYRSLLKDRTSTIDLGLDTRELARRINTHLDAGQKGKAQAENFLGLSWRPPESTLMHLAQSLGVQSTRNSARITGQGHLQIALGMSAAHYYCAGQVSFNTFLATSEDGENHENNFFLSAAQRKHDVWADAYDAERPTSLGTVDTPIDFRGASGAVIDGSSKKPSFPLYSIPLVNKSSTGYCLHWSCEVPAALQAGELLALRESQKEPWSIAVIRWIRQFKEQGTHIGVEILAMHASPCALRLMQKSGQNSEFLRALLLPAIAQTSTPESVIVPRMPFQSGHRVSLFHNGDSEQSQLSQRLSATGSISQFALKYRQNKSPVKAPTDSARGDEDFDSLWPSL
ncbi:MAG: GTPase [Halomonadaceae bacterium]|nr:MAG: GTPase [Halomonadaceae bacterium]